MSQTNTPLSLPQEQTQETVLFEGRPAVLDSFGRWIVTLLTLGVAACYWWLTERQRIRVTTQRIVVKTGLINVRTTFLELYRVKDLSVEEPLGERLLGYGRVVLTASDPTDPHLVLRGVRKPEALADQVRRCVEQRRRELGPALVAER